MTLWTSDEAVAATGGTTATPWEATGVSIDTRTLEPGDMFVALKDVRDGHDFVAQALANGAACALVSRIPDGVPADAPLLVVDDVLTGLEALGRAARARTDAKIIGVTGSVGKTSTKEMLRTALTGQGKIHAAEKSYNNHWGVPLTLARMPKDTGFAVIEIGMNHPGEIAPLAKLARPHVALITIVAPAHLEAFASVEDIAREKAAIFDGLEDGGIAIINADLDTTPILRDLAPAACQTFGTTEGADWQLLDAVTSASATSCRARHAGEAILFKLGAPGRHFAMNGLACLAAAQAAGADLGRAAVALSDWTPPSGRGQRRFIHLDAQMPEQGIDLFDDAYNANPASVGAALDVLAAATPPDPAGRKVAILGDMKELGPTEIALHAGFARHPAMDEITQVHCVGPLMKHLYDALPSSKQGLWAATSTELADSPLALVRAGDVLMIKGSLSMKMAQIVDAVAKLGQSVADNQEGHR
ncbi:UDP-N-acetylmuramoyl-tripeptide--D-alanyl-D-alanine ligase [Litoreibacter arenae]|uniref:UDP-N-acetylmuramoyl-tripeptide--D-alanyl-D-alanine ligase n=1 Tax=Litoreibacter arenae DSM 19593 TaxID=1123360 RepID=S9QIE6_9RHOB|nr:UDP-N-acetylmuramoyl-tripeptide--D-alanyl-D-alanine ligase [Litoreibacter arenae]EPX81231.1 UDP-N-acetylmuramoylalanyl-D-glutamyl-2,6- diaminopimelate--D-alanyl-D-alanine ligase [Litoreibacter arenae DSM 19593]